MRPRALGAARPGASLNARAPLPPPPRGRPTTRPLPHPPRAVSPRGREGGDGAPSPSDGGGRTSSPSPRDAPAPAAPRRVHASASATADVTPVRVAVTADAASAHAPASTPPATTTRPPLLPRLFPDGETELRTLGFAANGAVLAVAAGAAVLHAGSLAASAALAAATAADAAAAAATAAGTTAAVEAGLLARLVTVLGTDAVEGVRDAAGAVWGGYCATLANHPLAVPAAVSAVTYALGDVTAQAYEGRALTDVDAARVARSAVVGGALHGPLAALYFSSLDRFLTLSPAFGSGDAWYAPLACIALDQTVIALAWSSLHCASLGVLAGASPLDVARAVRAGAPGAVRAGWRVWPAVGAITFTLVPAMHRVLWVDMVELAWVTLLAAYGAQRRARRAARALASAPAAASPAAAASVLAAASRAACALPTAGVAGGPAADELVRGLAAETWDDDDDDATTSDAGAAALAAAVAAAVDAATPMPTAAEAAAAAGVVLDE